MQDETILLQRARTLEPEALAQIHDTYYVSIYRYVAFRVSDVPTAEDLTSEVFTRLLAALREKHAPQNTIRGWLFGVASRVVKEHYRRQRREVHAELNESVPGDSGDPVKSLEALLSRDSLEAALKELTDEQQHALALRFGYEMPIREVARAMGKSEGSIKMLQARAIAALSRKLNPSEAGA